MKIAIAGCAGRMGATLLREVQAAGDVTLVGGSAYDREAVLRALLIADIDPDAFELTSETKKLFKMADAVIDFTSPAYTAELAEAAASQKKILISGTTGLNKDQEKILRTAGEQTQVVWAPNMSAGVTLLTALTEQVASILSDEYDIEIAEIHHRHKLDAPSGTALGLGRAAAKGRKVDLEKVSVMGREGQTGERERGAIGFAVQRAGEVVGDHTVTFGGAGERIELTHRASDRSIYARGAIRAALWAKKQKPGFYSMRNVLGI